MVHYGVKVGDFRDGLSIAEMLGRVSGCPRLSDDTDNTTGANETIVAMIPAISLGLV